MIHVECYNNIQYSGVFTIKETNHMVRNINYVLFTFHKLLNCCIEDKYYCQFGLFQLKSICKKISLSFLYSLGKFQ